MGGWLNSAGAKASAAAVAAVAVGVGAYAAYAYSAEAELGAVTPLAGAEVRSATPAISIGVSNAGNLGRYTLRVDGRDVTTASSMTGGAIRLDGIRLGDGRHTVSVKATGDGMLGGGLNRSWAFTVDTHAPPLRLTALPSGWVREHTLALTGHTQPGVRVTAAADAVTAHAIAGGDGAFALSLGVSDGAIPLVVTATDAAGNHRSVTADIKVDATAPAVTFGLPDVVRSSRPRLEVDVSDTAHTHETVRLDGVRTHPGSRPQLPLSQGRHTLSVAAHDPAGNRTEKRLSFVVDSTERLGKATLRRGAVGQDVTDLQKLLRRQGFLHGPPSGVYAAGTVAAVRAFQKASDLPVDGAVGIYTLGALSGRITIDQSAHLLTLVAVRAPDRLVPGRARTAGVPHPGRSLHHHQQGREPDLGAASGRAVGPGRRADPARAGEPARDALDGALGARRRDPRHRRPGLDRLQRLARVHPDADPRRRAAVHDGQRRHGRLHPPVSGRV